MLNYIELYPNTVNEVRTIKGVNYPDSTQFPTDISDQTKVTYIILGHEGKGIKYPMRDYFNFTFHRLDYVRVYLDSTSEFYNDNLDLLAEWSDCGAEVYIYDSNGNKIK